MFCYSSTWRRIMIAWCVQCLDSKSGHLLYVSKMRHDTYIAGNRAFKVPGFQLGPKHITFLRDVRFHKRSPFEAPGIESWEFWLVKLWCNYIPYRYVQGYKVVCPRFNTVDVFMDCVLYFYTGNFPLTGGSALFIYH